MQTIKPVLFSAKTMFSAMPVRGGWSEPLAFGLLVGSVSSMCVSFWKFVFTISGILQPLLSIPISVSSPVLFLPFSGHAHYPLLLSLVHIP